MSKEAPNIAIFQYVAIAYNIVEAVFAVLFGLLAHSIALTGFGFEGVLESINEYILVRRIKKIGGDGVIAADKIKQEQIVPAAVLAFIFGSYVLVQSLKMIILHVRPLPSAAGIIIAVCSLIFMPLLAYWSYRKSNTAKGALLMGIKDIWVYMFLSLGLLLGLALNYWAGLWLADPVVGLLTAGYLYKKSLEGLLVNNGQNSSNSEIK